MGGDTGEVAGGFGVGGGSGCCDCGRLFLARDV